MDVQNELQRLPSVDTLLQKTAVCDLAQQYGRTLTVEAIRTSLDKARREIRRGGQCPSQGALVSVVSERLKAWGRPTLRPAINATGVVVHTNLGRAPLCQDALAAMVAVGEGYSNLEYDLHAGRRGSRYVHAQDLLCRLTGADEALVVNNNAAAVLLVLTALAHEREVVISRGQLVEIGGGFRIPDVMRQSGARLVEVGTTNRTHPDDYERAIGPDTAMLMLAHQSNFRTVGFTKQVSAQELAMLGHAHDLLVYEDLGSGTLLNTDTRGFSHEPTVQEAVAAGLDLVSFSGDKLLGAPQAGILVGRADLIARLRAHPLTRALRVDKTTLAGLQATLLHYLTGDAEETIPVWRMLALPLGELDRRASQWAQELSAAGVDARVVDGRSAAGGGSLPGETVPTRLVAIATDSPNALAAHLRASEPPVIARIENDLVCLDPRTVEPAQEPALLAAILSSLQPQGDRPRSSTPGPAGRSNEVGGTDN
jgi:L-seryl-tRNA(Ser) seleniumtransferase